MRGADINHESAQGLSPLHIAIRNRLPPKMIKFLIDNGADVN